MITSGIRKIEIAFEVDETWGFMRYLPDDNIKKKTLDPKSNVFF